MKRVFRTPLIYILILLAIILMATEFNLFPTGTSEELTYGEFIEKVSNGEIFAAQLTEKELVGIYKNSSRKESDLPGSYDFKLNVPSEQTFTKDMSAIAAKRLNASPDTISSNDYGFSFKSNKTPEPSFLVQILPYLLIIGVIIIFWYIMMQQQSGSGNKVMSFGKSRARTNIDEKNRVTFDDVAGADEEKEELKEIVDFLREPRRFTEMGARIPKGVLLVGPPGTGKTLLAKAVAGEAGVPFFSISGSDFVEMFVGVGASRVRDLFNTAKKNAPSIVFIDEIDAVGRHRGAGLGGGHDEREQTLNQLLVEMDGFAVNEGVIIIAATNRPDILDPALLRPGRFDRQITVSHPDVKGREEILKVHSKGKPLDNEVNLKTLAKRTPGFTGADLENILNESAILAARNKKPRIEMPQVEEAITRVILGPQKRSRIITEDDKRLTAYHEAGHAIVAHLMPKCDPVHEVSIIPRGRAGGYTMTLPKEDRSSLTRSQILDQIAMAMGGRVAEALVLDDISSGALYDLQHATDLARKMVVEYGMSDKLGAIYLAGDTEIFIGRDLGHQRNYSEDIAAQVDAEIRRIMEDGYQRAEKALSKNLEGMQRVVNALLEHERLDGADFIAIFEGASVPLTEEAKNEASAKNDAAHSGASADAAAPRRDAAQEAADAHHGPEHVMGYKEPGN